MAYEGLIDLGLWTDQGLIDLGLWTDEGLIDLGLWTDQSFIDLTLLINYCGFVFTKDISGFLRSLWNIKNFKRFECVEMSLI
jgi:hypothetical protein